MKGKRLIALLMVLALVGCLLVGCSSENGNTTNNEGETNSGDGQNGSNNGGETNTPDNNEYAVTDYSEIIPGTLTDVSISMSDSEKQALIDSHTDADGKTFVTVALIDDPGSMCAYGTGASKPRTLVLPLVYDRLFNRDNNAGELKPCVGESYEYIGDHVWEVKLAEGVVDTAGNEIKAEDVKFSLWDVALEKYSTNNIKTYCTNIEVVDDYTLHFTLTLEGPATFESRIATNYVFSKASYEASADGMITTPVGSGPYVVESWETGSQLVLVKNENYWDTDPSSILQQANVDKIVLKVIKDSAQRVIALEAGEIDFLSSVDETDLPNFESSDYVTTFAYAGQRETLYFNCAEDCPLGDPKVRQAVCYAISSEDCMLGASGSGRLCYTVAPYTAGNYHTEWESQDYFEYNPEKALELLEEAGVDPSELTIVIMTENTPELNVRIAQIIQAQLLEIGITVEIKPVDGALFSEYKYDKTSSDIIIAATGGDGSTVVPSFASNDYKTTSEVSGLTHIVDDYWMDLQNKALEGEYDNEYIDQCHEYIKENVFGYALYHPALYCITTGVVKGYTLLIQSYDCPGCLQYIWND